MHFFSGNCPEMQLLDAFPTHGQEVARILGFCSDFYTAPEDPEGEQADRTIRPAAHAIRF
jgi:hypothetical protein